MTAPYEPRQDFAGRPATAAPARRWTGPVVWGPGPILGALGTLFVVASLFTSWRTSAHPSAIPVAFLWDKTTKATDPSLLILLIPILIVLIVGTLSPLGRGLRAFGGLATLVVVGLFAYQLSQLVGLAHNGTNVSDVLSTGWYLAAIGGFFALASAFAPSRSSRRGYSGPGYQEPY